MNDIIALMDGWQLLNPYEGVIASTEPISVIILPIEPLIYFEFYELENKVVFYQYTKREFEKEWKRKYARS